MVVAIGVAITSMAENPNRLKHRPQTIPLNTIRGMPPHARVHSPDCQSGGLFSVGVGTGLVVEPAGPEGVQGLAVAE